MNMENMDDIFQFFSFKNIIIYEVPFGLSGLTKFIKIQSMKAIVKRTKRLERFMSMNNILTMYEDNELQ